MACVRGAEAGASVIQYTVPMCGVEHSNVVKISILSCSVHIIRFSHASGLCISFQLTLFVPLCCFWYAPHRKDLAEIYRMSPYDKSSIFTWFYRSNPSHFYSS